MNKENAVLMLLHHALQLPNLSSSQVTSFSQLPKVLVFHKLVNVFSPPCFLSGHWLLVSYPRSETLCTAYGSIYLNHPL